MKKYTIVFFLLVIAVLGSLSFYYFRWKHLWDKEKPIPRYIVKRNNDDTIRVLLLGDSWAANHSGFDSFLCSKIQAKVSKPVVVKSRGKGGEKSRGLYRLLFDNDSLGMRELIELGADYSVVFAGINDAAANLGTTQFCYHYMLILDFLLNNGIRPVVIEIPDVDIWHLYCDKNLKDLVADYLKSVMTGCKMYEMSSYRESLYKNLSDNGYLDSVIYIPTTLWNDKGQTINLNLFLPDKIHLNIEGYKKLDECLAEAIIGDILLTH